MELTPGLCSQPGRSAKCLDLLSAQYCFQSSRTIWPSTLYYRDSVLSEIKIDDIHTINGSILTFPVELFHFCFINTGPFLLGWKLWQISNWTKSSYWSLPHYIAQYAHYMITLTGNSRKYVFYNAKLHASCGGLKHLAKLRALLLKSNKGSLAFIYAYSYFNILNLYTYLKLLIISEKVVTYSISYMTSKIFSL